MITLSGSRVFFLLLLPFLLLRLRLCFFFYSPPFSRTVEGNHCRMLKRICIFARCCHAPPPPFHSTRQSEILCLVCCQFFGCCFVGCLQLYYFWRRLHQIRQCRQAESFLSLSPSSSVVPFVMLVFCVCQFYASSSKLCVQMAFT